VIASSLGAATLVLSPRSAGKSSWKSRISSERGASRGVFFFLADASFQGRYFSNTLCGLCYLLCRDFCELKTKNGCFFSLSVTLSGSCRLVNFDLMASNITTVDI
jgi:hypothetical protein